jgi:hypothetical protein
LEFSFIHDVLPRPFLRQGEPKDQQLAPSPGEMNRADPELSSSVGTAQHHVLVVCGCFPKHNVFKEVVDVLLSWANSPLAPSSDIIPWSSSLEKKPLIL